MRYFIFILFLFFAGNAYSINNPFWVLKDKKIIAGIVKLNKNNPREFEQHFKNYGCDTTTENLGFGWKAWRPGIGGGYASVSAEFYYYYDSIISYSLTPYLSDKKNLIKRYKKLYGNYFSYINDKIQPYRYNETALLKPLVRYKGNLKTENSPKKLLEYMSPVSGTMYGHYGGGVIMKNRKAFNQIKDSLTSEQVLLMMYSINPASRLTAIEHYLKRNWEKLGQQPSVEHWISKIFKETPKIKTMSGCFLITESPEGLFPWFYINRYSRLQFYTTELWMIPL